MDTPTPEGSPTLSTDFSTPELNLSPELSDYRSSSHDSGSPILLPDKLRVTPIEYFVMALSC